MCLSIPARVDEINGEIATCSVGKSNYEANLQMIEFEDVKVGDYVLIHTGFAIQKLDAEEAEASLRTFDEFKELNDQLDKEEKEGGSHII
ncbi:MAG: HypC/HybG/HupF family hydrogenase formation chaperone [Chlorobi bacterium]|nr:HypC/HybG/HupF family hydrogenase formation chaperone [Chlorobiota bacterium]